MLIGMCISGALLVISLAALGAGVAGFITELILRLTNEKELVEDGFLKMSYHFTMLGVYFGLSSVLMGITFYSIFLVHH